MKALTEYKKNGYKFTLVRRLADLAVFEGVNSTDHTTWELIKVQSHEGREIAGVQIPPAEYPPSNTEWGSKGWTFTSRQAAIDELDRKALHDNSPTH